MNHNQTWKEEIGGGYLWSPRREARARSQYYDNMRVATRGDIVLSYSRQRVAYVGVVTDDAVSAPKPSEFGSKGSYWSDEGWMLPVAWEPVPTPVSPRSVWPGLSALLPTKYSPLDRNGDGAQKAYFAEVSVEVFSLMAGLAGLDGPPRVQALPRFDTIESALDEIIEEAITIDGDLSETERSQTILARKGQGIFRDRVSELEPGCRLTGVITPTLLVASHIKPWRSCESTTERLDGCNGLLLTPSADRLFDRGLVTFEDDGRPRFSPRLATDDQRRLGFAMFESPRPFSARQILYLQHHRTTTFLS